MIGQSGLTNLGFFLSICFIVSMVILGFKMDDYILRRHTETDLIEQRAKEIYIDYKAQRKVEEMLDEEENYTKRS